LVSIAKQITLDFGDKRGEVSFSETQIGSGDAMMLDVRRNMLVVREGKTNPS
jgi:hypothetical protein